MRSLACGVLFCLLIAGCAFSRGNVGTKFNDDTVAMVQKGVSTRPDVAALLGAPDRILDANGQQIFQYYHYDLKHGTLLFFSRVNIASDDLYVLFNPEGVVDDVVFGTRTKNLKFQFWPFGD
jgi:outer membrane protein assembly factor BamE (lipoprotein component of BamABCDE complex)